MSFQGPRPWLPGSRPRTCVPRGDTLLWGVCAFPGSCGSAAERLPCKAVTRAWDRRGHPRSPPRGGGEDRDLQNRCVSLHPPVQGSFCLRGVSACISAASVLRDFGVQDAFSSPAAHWGGGFSALQRRAHALLLSLGVRGRLWRVPGEEVLGSAAAGVSAVLVAHLP